MKSLSPLGCMTDFGVSCEFARSEGAPLAKREMFAAVSSNAVVLRLGGLAQPENIVDEHNNCILALTTLTAGSHRHFAIQVLLASFPPMMLLRVALS